MNEDSEDDAPATKKVRGKGKKAAPKEEPEEDDVVEEEAPKPKRAKKAVTKKEIEADDTEEPVPVKTTKRGKKVIPKKETDADDTADKEPEPPKAKRGKKAATADGENAAPQKRYEITTGPPMSMLLCVLHT